MAESTTSLPIKYVQEEYGAVRGRREGRDEPFGMLAQNRQHNGNPPNQAAFGTSRGTQRRVKE
jgi:hypothetical protein